MTSVTLWNTDPRKTKLSKLQDSSRLIAMRDHKTILHISIRILLYHVNPNLFDNKRKIRRSRKNSLEPQWEDTSQTIPSKFKFTPLHKQCFKCGDIGHIQSVCNTTVHLIETNIKSCNSDSIKSRVPNDHLSLSTISKDSVESCSSSELNETQNSCETKVSNQSTYQISHVIVPDIVFPNDSLIFDEIPCKSEENMLSEHNYDRKPDVVLIDADFSNNLLLCNDILNKREETISEESNLDVLSNIICPHNAFVSCGKLVQCEA
ncbi:unnamed protein product [Schistosoma margrebowiei]|uniref:Uncharacterized protein n=1 Tax=Schistosoma margrebowiei TaxID=48269 RepID=A0A183MG45_9TREM|nr:unnamed protein product [Schistosoma margrebowiei]